MDGLTLADSSVQRHSWIHRCLERLITLAWMCFKSAYFSGTEEGEISQQVVLPCRRPPVLSTSVESIKSLGKTTEELLPEEHCIHPTMTPTPGWWQSGLTWRFKVWIYQHKIPSCFLWPLQVYNVPLSTIEWFKKSHYFHRFLRLPCSPRNPTTQIIYRGHQSEGWDIVESREASKAGKVYIARCE